MMAVELPREEVALLLVTLTAGILMLAAYRRGAPALWA